MRRRAARKAYSGESGPIDGVGRAAGTPPRLSTIPAPSQPSPSRSSPAGLDAAALELIAAATGAGLPVGVHVRHGSHSVCAKGVAVQAAVAAGPRVRVLKPVGQRGSGGWMRRLAGRAAVWASAPPCPKRAATPAQVWLRAASAPGGTAVGEEAVGILLRLQQVAVGCGWGAPSVALRFSERWQRRSHERRPRRRAAVTSPAAAAVAGSSPPCTPRHRQLQARLRRRPRREPGQRAPSGGATWRVADDVKRTDTHRERIRRREQWIAGGGDPVCRAHVRRRTAAACRPAPRLQSAWGPARRISSLLEVSNAH